MPSSNHSLCGPGCRYRALYEGTQSTLADLAGKQAGALNRLGRLRQGLVLLLQATAPRRFAELESTLGMRLSEVDDETLLSCAQWLMEPVRDEAALTELRTALAAAGFPLASSTSPVDLLEVVRDATPVTPRSASAKTPPAAPLTSLPAGRSFAEARRALSTPQPPGPLPGSPTPPAQHPGTPAPRPAPPTGTTSPELTALFDTDPAPTQPHAAPTESSTPPKPKRPNRKKSTKSAPTQPEPEPFLPTPAGPAQLDELEPGVALDPSSVLDAIAGAVTPLPDVHGPAPEPGELDADETGDLSELFDDEAPLQDELSDYSELAEPLDDQLDDQLDGFGELDEFEPGEGFGEPGPVPAAEPEPPVPATPVTAATPEPTPEPDPEPAPEPAPVRTVRTAPPLRPELFPQMTRAAGLPARRRSRVSATAPGTLDVPNAPATPNLPADDSLDARLTAAVAIPRPVFVSDLVAQVGSANEVESWVERCRANPESPFRFIPPKARHRLRGSLVLPVGYLREAAAEFSGSWWSECLERFHGSKLYEMAVLLHTLGDGVRSWKVNPEGTVLTMRITQPRGIVGLVVVLDDRFARGEPSRTALSDHVAELLSDRLELIVVLATTDPMFEPLIAALLDESTQQNWRPNCHVVAARSWEWASGNAAATRHVLG